MSDREPELRAIFCEALEYPTSAAQLEYVERVCLGKPELRVRVEALLEAHHKAGSFFQRGQPQVPTLDIAPIVEKPGMMIGRYKLVHEIGQGGMGVVYMAVQKEPVKRKVALKIIKPGMDTKEVVARFNAERQALAMMDHQCIATVLDGGSTDSGRPYFVMELVDGTPITEYCDECRYTTRQRLELFIQVCHAVQHAHLKGVIHRDIKPSNILVTTCDTVAVPKVIDFGIAKAVHQPLTDASVYTQVSQMVGTPLYMSPEQAERTGQDVDTRTDEYSLGVLLYELLTGTTPFDKQRLLDSSLDEVKRIIREEEPPKPSTRLSTLGTALDTVIEKHHTDRRTLTQELSGELDWIVMKAMEKDRNRRYESAKDLAKDVQRYLDDEPVEACPPSTTYRLRKFAHRHKARLAAVAVLATVLLAATIVSTCLAVWAMRAQDIANTRLVNEKTARREAESAEDRERHVRTKAEQQEAVAVNQRDAAKQNLYVADMRLAQHDWKAGQISRLHRMLDSHMPEPDQPDLRSWEWFYLLTLCHSELLTMRGHQQPVYSVAWSPDEKRLASGSGDGAVRIWNVTTGDEISTLRRSMSAVRSVGWSRDGRFLASGAQDGSVTIWDPATGKERFVPPGHTAAVRCVVWSPHNSLLASAAQDGTIKIWDTDAEEQVLSWNTKASWLSGLAWNSDGQRLASSQQGGIKIWDVGTGRELISWGGWEVLAVAWSPDGQRLASGSYGPDLQVREASTGQQEIKVSTTDAVMSVAWSPDGKLVAGATASQEIKVWDATTGEEVLTLRGHLGPIQSIAWSADGTQLASGGSDGTVKLWAARKRQNPLVFDHRSAHGVAWSPDGSRLATSGGGFVKIWNPIKGQEILSIESQKNALAWSPTGKQIATGSGRSTVKIWDVEEGNEVTFETSAEINPAAVQCSTCMAWGPEGKRLAVAVGDTVKLFDASTGQERLSMQGHSGYVYSVRWSPNGRSVASTAYDGTVRIWDPATGKIVFTLHGHAAGCWLSGLAWSPDSKYLASCGADRVIKVWDAVNGSELRSLEGHVGRPWVLAWSPDGKRLASGGVDGAIKIWCPATGEELFSLDDLQDYIRGLDWSPDGKFLAVAATRTGVRVWDASKGFACANSATYLANLQISWAKKNLREGASEEAIAACNEAIRLDPTFVVAYRHRGQALAMLKRWSEAASDFERAVELEYSFYDSYSSALVELALANRAEYASKCNSMLARFADTQDAAAAELTAWTCVLAPYILSDRARAVQLAEQALSDDPMEQMRLATYGAALYRAGRFDEAVQILRQAVQVDGNPSGSSRTSLAYVCLFLSLAEHQLGNSAEARKWLGQAGGLIDEACLRDNESTDSGTQAWNRRLTLKLLREEAESLLNETPAPSDSLPPANAALAYYYYSRGRVQAEKGLREYALTDLSKAIHLDPLYAAAYAARGALYAKQQLDQALADSAEATRLDAKYAPDLCGLIESVWIAGELDRAFSEYSSVITIAPHCAHAYLGRGRVHAERGETAKALFDFTQAIRADADCAEAFAERGFVYAKLGQIELAEADWRETRRIDPGCAQTYFRRGVCFQQGQQRQRGVSEFGKAIQLDPQFAPAYRERGKILCQQNKHDEALADLSEAVKCNAADADAWRWRGKANFGLQQMDQALADFAKTVQLDPNHRLAFRESADVQERLGQYDAALREYEKALAVDQLDNSFFHRADVRWRCATCLARLGRWEESLECTDPLSAIESGNARDGYHRVGILLKTNRIEEYREECADMIRQFGESEKGRNLSYVVRACVLGPSATDDATLPVKLAQRNVAASPNVQWTVHTLAMAHLRADQLDEAERRFRESMEIDPDWPAGFLNWLGLALVHHQRGDEQKAREWFTKAIGWMDEHREDNFGDWLEGEILRREADKLLNPRDEDLEDPKQEDASQEHDQFG